MTDFDLKNKLRQELENVQQELDPLYTHDGKLSLHERCDLYCATYRLAVVAADYAGITLEPNDCGTWSTVDFEIKESGL